jgi:hypothetical protein
VEKPSSQANARLANCRLEIGGWYRFVAWLGPSWFLM